MNPNRLVHKSVQYLFVNRKDGDIFQDASPHDNWLHLTLIVRDRQEWKNIIRKIK